MTSQGSLGGLFQISPGNYLSVSFTDDLLSLTSGD